MQLTLYQIDAFAARAFEGNPAAVCPLREWLPDDLMQSIAAENNLSETAFFVPAPGGYHIRWFTPAQEVDLCGHATLASAYVIFHVLNEPAPRIEFQSRGGVLGVARDGEWLELDFPAQPPEPCEVPALIEEAFTNAPAECLRAADYILVFDDEDKVLNAEPDHSVLAQLDLRGVAITAASQRYDFVNRFFAPKHGINEDPVTGSAFTELIPYWAGKLNKKTMTAKQVSRRGGEVRCALAGDRVKIAGKAVAYMTGTIDVEV